MSLCSCCCCCCAGDDWDGPVPVPVQSEEEVEKEEEGKEVKEEEIGAKEGTAEREHETYSKKDLAGRAKVELTKGRVRLESPDVLMATLGFGKVALLAPTVMVVRFANPGLLE